MAAATTAAKPSVSKGGGQQLPPEQGIQPCLPHAVLCVRYLEKGVGAREMRLGAPEILAGGNGNREIGDQHRGQHF